MYPYNKQLARTLRKSETPTEQLLWYKIRNRQINGFKFRRQHPIGKYVVDFFCAEINLVLEVDGDVHAIPENLFLDKKREENLKKLGLTVFRVANNDVRGNLDGVLEQLFDLTPTLSSRRGGTKRTLSSRRGGDSI